MSSITLKTDRLVLCTPCKEDALKLQQFYELNSTHLPPWESPMQISTEDLLREWEKEIQEGRSIRFLLFLEEELIGMCNFTQIFRRAFQACYLGYKIDKRHEGKGLMTEALTHAIQYMFDQENIHRIMANYMPTNQRSAHLLKRLGFSVEGHAKDYLFINGKWEDHVLTSLININWSKKTSTSSITHCLTEFQFKFEIL